MSIENEKKSIKETPNKSYIKQIKKLKGLVRDFIDNELLRASSYSPKLNSYRGDVWEGHPDFIGELVRIILWGVTEINESKNNEFKNLSFTTYRTYWGRDENGDKDQISEEKEIDVPFRKGLKYLQKNFSNFTTNDLENYKKEIINKMKKDKEKQLKQHEKSIKTLKKMIKEIILSKNINKKYKSIGIAYEMKDKYQDPNGMRFRSDDNYNNYDCNVKSILEALLKIVDSTSVAYMLKSLKMKLKVNSNYDSESLHIDVSEIESFLRNELSGFNKREFESYLTKKKNKKKEMSR